MKFFAFQGILGIPVLHNRVLLFGGHSSLVTTCNVLRDYNEIP